MWINPRPTLSRLGGKAYQLHRLKRWCNVPPYFVIAFENPDEILDPKNQSRIAERCREQKLEVMAVRSSASCEDSARASFAGMFRTVLGVRSSEVVGAIAEVLSSASSKRVADYCSAHGFDENAIGMAVIVQKMVNSRVSGVCFTRSELGGNSLLVEGCYGLGEALVSGAVTPDTYVVDRERLSVVKESAGYQRTALRMFHDSPSPAYAEVPFHKRNAKKLTCIEIRAIAEACLLAERRLGFHAADVEWAFEGDTLYLLQARPYTALPSSPGEG